MRTYQACMTRRVHRFHKERIPTFDAFDDSIYDHSTLSRAHVATRKSNGYRPLAPITHTLSWTSDVKRMGQA